MRESRSSEKRQINRPVDKVVPTVTKAIEKVNLGEELERKEAGGEPTLDNLPTEKPALQTGDSVPGQWNIKGKGLKAHENKIINHFTKAY